MRTWRMLTVMALLATVGFAWGPAAPAQAAYPTSTAILTNIYNGVPNLGDCRPQTDRGVSAWEDIIFLQDNSSATVVGRWSCPGRIGVLSVTYRDANPAREVRPLSMEVRLEATLYAVADGDPGTQWPCGYDAATHRMDRIPQSMKDHQLPQLFIEDHETWCGSSARFAVSVVPRTADETTVAWQCQRTPGCVIP